VSGYDFSLAEDLRRVRGAIDSQAWVLNNTHNAGSALFAIALGAAREDAEKGRDALDRIEQRLADQPKGGTEC
jgi:hypothetical protein